MALPPGTTDEAFLREVDEELRRDQLLTFWRRWGKWVIGAVIAALVAFAGVLYLQARNERGAGRQGEQYAKALTAQESGQAAQADPELAKLASGGQSGFRALARFTQADALIAKQDLKGAAAKLGEIAADASAPQPLRDEALVRQTAVEFDTLPPQAVIDRLKPLTNPDSAWFGSAGELVATAYLKQGKRDAARALFSQIAQSKGPVPDSIRQRTVQMAGVLDASAKLQSEDKKAQ